VRRCQLWADRKRAICSSALAYVSFGLGWSRTPPKPLWRFGRQGQGSSSSLTIADASCTREHLINAVGKFSHVRPMSFLRLKGECREVFPHPPEIFPGLAVSGASQNGSRLRTTAWQEMKLERRATLHPDADAPSIDPMLVRRWPAAEDCPPSDRFLLSRVRLLSFECEDGRPRQPLEPSSKRATETP
jgi:hypothetical protein